MKWRALKVTMLPHGADYIRRVSIVYISSCRPFVSLYKPICYIVCARAQCLLALLNVRHMKYRPTLWNFHRIHVYRYCEYLACNYRGEGEGRGR